MSATVLGVLAVLGSGVVAGVLFAVALSVLPALFAMPMDRYAYAHKLIGRNWDPTTGNDSLRFIVARSSVDCVPVEIPVALFNADLYFITARHYFFNEEMKPVWASLEDLLAPLARKRSSLFLTRV